MCWVAPFPTTKFFCLDIMLHDRIHYAKFYVISGKNKQESLLGTDSSTSLGVLKILNLTANEKDINSNKTRETNLMSDILKEYESIFHRISKMKDVKMKLAVDESETPVPQKHSS